MATIRTFTKTSAGFTGTIQTVGLKPKVAITPIEKRGEFAPDYRVFVGKVEIGAGWARTSKGGREFVSLKLDDLSELPRNLRNVGMRIALQRVQGLGPVIIATSMSDSPFSNSLDVASWRRSCKRKSLRPSLSRAGPRRPSSRRPEGWRKLRPPQPSDPSP